MFAKLPFRTAPSDEELPEDSACPSVLNCRHVPQPRSSTAFSLLDHADVTTHEPVDISVDPSSETFVYPIVREAVSPLNPPHSLDFCPRDFQSFAFSTPQRSSPTRIALQVEDISDSDDIKGSVEDILDTRDRQANPPVRSYQYSAV